MRSTIVPVPVLALLALLAGGCDRQSPAPPQGKGTNAAADAAQPDEVTEDAAPKGGAIDTSHKGEPAPVHGFADVAGKPHTLADFRGRPVLVNLWATWCGPCIRELPTLDALAAREAGRLRLVLLSQDTDAAKVAPFVARHGVKAAVYTDARMAWLPSVTATLPTTIVYDAAGREAFRVTGDRDWASAETAAALAAIR